MSMWTDALGKQIDCIHRFGCCLVGLTHVNKNGQNRMELIRSTPIGTELVLAPEADNPADRNAILIYRAGDLANDLGYMHAIQAKHYCPLIERGATFTAQLYWINRAKPDYLEAYFYLFQLTAPALKSRPVRRNVPPRYT